MLPQTMTKLTPSQVRHIAKLARLTLSDAEVEKYATELSAILNYIEKLNEVDTSRVEATAQVTGKRNAVREDAVYASPLASPDALLSCSPLPIVDHQIQAQSAHGEEG